MSVVGPTAPYTLKRNIFTCDVAVQTEHSALKVEPLDQMTSNFPKFDGADEPEYRLSAAELSSILKWSKIISIDINLSSGTHFILERYVTHFHFLQLFVDLPRSLLVMITLCIWNYLLTEI